MKLADVNKKIFGVIRLLPKEVNWQWRWAIFFSLIIPLADVINSLLIYLLVVLLQAGAGSIHIAFHVFHRSDIISVAVLLIISVFVRQGMEYASLYTSRHLTQNIYRIFSRKLVEHYLAIPWLSFMTDERSAKIKNCTVTALDAAFSFQVVLNIITAFVTIVILGAATVMKSVPFSICIVLVMFLLMLFKKFYINKKVDLAYQNHDSYQRLYFHKIYEIFNLSREINIFNTGDHFIQGINKDLESLSKVKTDMSIYPQMSQILLDILLTTVLAVIIIVTSFKNPSSSKEFVADIATIAILGRRLLPSINLFFSNYTELYGSANNLEIMERELSTVVQKAHITNDLHGAQLIKLTDITFNYPEQKSIFNKFNLDINEGDRIAIVGETGNGKSTLIMIATGILIPHEGTVRANESFTGYPSPFAYVPQQVELLNGSIRDNIIFGSKNIDEDLVNLVLKAVNLSDHINKLAEKTNTLIGDNGYTFSGGQRQRLGIARALYVCPKILFLDEATGALDEQTEFCVMSNINEYMKDGAVVFITHRKSNADQHASRICHL